MSHGDWNTPELRALRDTVTEFVRREVLPHQDEWEAAGELPRELSRTAGELGLLGVGFPEKAGGAKTFITSGCRADFVTTAVRTGGPGHGGVSLLHQHWAGSDVHWFPGNHLLHLQQGRYLRLMKKFMDRNVHPDAPDQPALAAR